MIKNINSPTPPFWNKVILASAAAGGVISGAAYLYHLTWLQVVGVALLIVGSVGPIFMPGGNKE